MPSKIPFGIPFPRAVDHQLSVPFPLFFVAFTPPLPTYCYPSLHIGFFLARGNAIFPILYVQQSPPQTGHASNDSFLPTSLHSPPSVGRIAGLGFSTHVDLVSALLSVSFLSAATITVCRAVACFRTDPDTSPEPPGSHLSEYPRLHGARMYAAGQRILNIHTPHLPLGCQTHSSSTSIHLSLSFQFQASIR